MKSLELVKYGGLTLSQTRIETEPGKPLVFEIIADFGTLANPCSSVQIRLKHDYAVALNYALEQYLGSYDGLGFLEGLKNESTCHGTRSYQTEPEDMPDVLARFAEGGEGFEKPFVNEDYLRIYKSGLVEIHEFCIVPCPLSEFNLSRVAYERGKRHPTIGTFRDE